MSASAASRSEVRTIGKIPVRNLWLLMLYASDLYRQLGTTKIDVEDNLEEIADLVAEILCHQVEQRLMRNLSFGYQSKVDVISRVRGRIDTLYTERHRLLDKGKVCCRFEELTVDTSRNRYVRAALEQALGHKNELVFLDCLTDKTENVYPMIPAGAGLNEMILV